MKADLYVDGLNGPNFCLLFPEVGVLSESGRDGQVYGVNDERAEYWIKKELVFSLEVPFDLIARLYCYHMNFRIGEFRRADHELWLNTEVKKAMTLSRVKT